MKFVIDSSTDSKVAHETTIELIKTSVVISQLEFTEPEGAYHSQITIPYNKLKKYITLMEQDLEENNSNSRPTLR